MKNKKDIQKALKNSLNLQFSIKARNPSPDQISKSLFVGVINTMIEIQDRTDFMISELGIDMIAYEDKYFRVIENLFKLHFNESQLSLIQLYLYELKPDKSWDGTIELELGKGKEPSIHNFKEAKDVWEVIKLFEDKL